MYVVSPRIIGILVVVLSLGLAAPALALDRLPSDSHVDYQLGGAAPVLPGVGVVVRDRTDAPAPGMANVCYVNGFQTQPNERSFWRGSKRWGLVLKRRGRPVVDAQWGEWLLDIRTPRKRRALAAIMGRWIEGCALKGFVAVEFDNLDSFTRSRRLLKRRHAIAFARLLVQRAHRVGLLAGQKNLADFNGTRIGYDFAVAEECGRYDECDAYTGVYGDQVIAIEYRRRDFRRTCAQVGDLIAVEMRDRDLSPSSVRRWC